MFCNQCGKPMEENAKFCAFCGAPAANEIIKGSNENQAMDWKESEVKPQQPQPVLEKQKSVNLLIKACIAFIIIGLIGFGVKAVFNVIGGSRPGALLVKAEEGLLYAPSLMNKERMQLSSTENVEQVQYSEDGKKAYYIVVNDNYFGTLYCADLSKMRPNSDQNSNYITKISNNVLYDEFMTGENGETMSFRVLGNQGVIFIKGMEAYNTAGLLKVYDGKSTFTIAKDVSRYLVSTNQSSVLFYQDEVDYDNYNYHSNLYYCNLEQNAQPQIISEKLYNVEYISDNLDSVIYLQQNDQYKEDESYSMENDLDLYRWTPKTGSEPLIENIYMCYSVTENGDYYYTKVNKLPVRLKDYIEDNYIDADAAVKKPLESDFQSTQEIALFGQTFSDTITDYIGYYKAVSEYDEVEERNTLRKELEDYESYQTVFTLYYRSGGKDSLLTDKMLLCYDSIEYFDTKNKIAIFSVMGEEADIKSKVSISDISNANEVEEFMWNMLPIGATYLSYQGKAPVEVDISVTNVNTMQTAKDGKTIYGSQFSVIGEENLYALSITGSGIVKKEIADNIINYYYSQEQDKLFYFVNASKKDYYDKADLYAYENGNSVLIKDNMSYQAPIQLYDNGMLMFYKNYKDYDDQQGTLYTYQNGILQEVDKYVKNAVLIEDGSIRYLKECQYPYGGDLYIYKENGKTEKVDDNILQFFCKNVRKSKYVY